jgi:hypothetical protein
MMKPTPFNADTDLAPIPFSPKACLMAEQLKRHGLEWRPHVGCFVWDKGEQIEVKSPFPNRIYFILNMGHFLKRFQTAANMAKHLVWLPTWHQAREIGRRLKVPSEQIGNRIPSDDEEENDLVVLYEIILETLKANRDPAGASH